MKENYTSIVANHYHAYRPPLHTIILKKTLDPQMEFKKALDIGCGTGRSSITLLPFCEEIVGIEPSKDMLAKTIAHEKITYQWYDKKQLNFPDTSFDLITLAGSLYYAKSRFLLEEILRVAKVNAKLLIYDFNILLDEIYGKLNLLKPQSEINYNHQEDFSDTIESRDNIKLDLQEKTTTSFSIQSSDLAHLMLSSVDIYPQLMKYNNSENLHEELKEKLQSFCAQKLNVFTYCTKYVLNT